MERQWSVAAHEKVVRFDEEGEVARVITKQLHNVGQPPPRLYEYFLVIILHGRLREG